MGRLNGKKVAFLIADMTHDEEYSFPKYWLAWEGAKVVTIGLSKQHISRFNRSLTADLTISDAKADDYDAVVIPGGFGPDRLRANKEVIKFVREMMEKGKIIAAICHGPQVLISANIIKDRKLTCVEQIAIDVINAGGNYLNEPVVIDGNLITSRHPEDLPAFTTSIIEALLK
ncbi:MAG: type 1 glutamine amidotransferase domain-containing protein [Candidatus Methanomethylicia archaeon]